MKSRMKWKKVITALLIGSQITRFLPGYGVTVFAEGYGEERNLEISTSESGIFSEEMFLNQQGISTLQEISLDLSNDSFQLTDIRDSSSVCSFDGADGKQAVILFGFVSTCDYTTLALGALTQLVSMVDMSQLNIYVILVEKSDREDIFPKLENVSEQIMVSSAWNYEENKWKEECSDFYDKCFRAAGKASGVAMPLILYKGADGAVYGYTAGYGAGQTNLDTIIENVSKGGLEVGTNMLFGDSNGDGVIDSRDAVMVKQYMAGYTDQKIDLSASDVNADGTVDSKDAVKILKKLAGYDVVLGEE